MHRKVLLLLLLSLLELGLSTALAQGPIYQLTGTLTSQAGEPLAGAHVLINPGERTVSADERGRFSLRLEPGEYTVECQYLGMERIIQKVNLQKDMHLPLVMKTSATGLRQVEVVAKSAMDVNSTQMGSTYMDVQLLSKMPALLGEVDVIRSVASLPGVVSAGEGSAGFYVRGGSADQNLVLLDDVPVFNSAHLFGFFSVYNPDVLKSYTLHRSGISARYGSRISSILDVQLRDGNPSKMQYQVGISPISAKFSLDGPVSSRLTVLAAGRAAYPTYLLRMFKSDNIRNSSGHFYDFNLKANYKLNERNTISFSSYHSDDGFKFPFDTTYQWSNTLGSLKWTHVYGQKLSSAVTVAKSVYTNNTAGIATGDEFNLRSGIDFTQLKADLAYFGQKRHAIDFGGGVSYYSIEPGRLEPYGSSSLNPRALQADKGTEYHAYLNDEITLNSRLSVSLGLRHTYFVKKGPTDVYLFAEGRPRGETSIIDTLVYGEGSRVHSYQGLEPRASVRFLLSDARSLKASYGRTRQYLQLVSNTAAITPVDVWKLANTHLRPQVADQVAVGYFYVKPDNAYEFSWEVYYKWLHNQVDYKDGAVLLLNPALEAELLTGKGKAYGSEWLLKKNTGRNTGWLSLTYSRSMRQFAGNTPEETINSGEWYPSNYDKPINVNVFVNRQLHPRWTLSGNLNYTTGRPITASDSWYRYYGYIFANYVGRNQGRMPDYHRLDASLNYEFEKRKRVAYTASFSVYNLYGRKNAYSAFFRHYYGSPPEAYKLAIIGVPIPSVNLNARF